MEILIPIYLVCFIVGCVLFYYTPVFLFAGIKFFGNENEEYSRRARYKEALKYYYECFKDDELFIFYKVSAQALDLVRFGLLRIF